MPKFVNLSCVAQSGVVARGVLFRFNKLMAKERGTVQPAQLVWALAISSLILSSGCAGVYGGVSSDVDAMHQVRGQYKAAFGVLLGGKSSQRIPSFALQARKGGFNDLSAGAQWNLHTEIDEDLHLLASPNAFLNVGEYFAYEKHGTDTIDLHKAITFGIGTGVAFGRRSNRTDSPLFFMCVDVSKTLFPGSDPNVPPQVMLNLGALFLEPSDR
jgi:hypothetical protein